MPVDKIIQDALQETVKVHGQGQGLAEKLTKWFTEVVAGNERIDDRDAAYRRLDNITAAIEVSVQENGEGDSA